MDTKQLMKYLIIASILIGFMLFIQCSTKEEQSWELKVDVALSEAGHRNWIVIADAAYPKQSAQGIETIATGKNHLEVLNIVLKRIENAPHVSAVVMLDSELDYVPENAAAGIEVFRNELKNLLNGKQVNTMKHENIISQLDEASMLFNIIILKTNMTMPYTSVFLKLDCGYWNLEQEDELRKLMNDSE